MLAVKSYHIWTNCGIRCKFQVSKSEYCVQCHCLTDTPYISDPSRLHYDHIYLQGIYTSHTRLFRESAVVCGHIFLEWRQSVRRFHLFIFLFPLHEPMLLYANIPTSCRGIYFVQKGSLVQYLITMRKPILRSFLNF